MLVLMCSVGPDRLALSVSNVIEVIPRVALQRPSDAPGRLAGHFVYRGVPIPVVSLQPQSTQSGNRLSNRIIVVEVPVDSRREAVGLLVEGATTQQLADSDVATAMREGRLRSQWGTILLDAAGMFHLVDLETILPPELLATLFPPVEESLR
jgi:chemotaxis signal transduction protein